MNPRWREPTPSVPKYLSLENRVSLTDTFSGQLTLRDGVVPTNDSYLAS
jgi:hypothetical protein